MAGEAAIVPVQLENSGQQGNLAPLNHVTVLFQVGAGPFEYGANFPIGVVVKHRGRRQEGEPFGDRRQRLVGAGGHRLEQRPGVGHRPRHRPEGIEGGRQRHAAVGGDEAIGGLQSHDAVERRRDANGATGIAADGGASQTRCHCHTRPRRGPAGNACRICGTGRGAEMRVDADAGEGQFGHVGLAKKNRTGRVEPGRHRAVLARRRSLGEHPRTGGRYLISGVNEIFDGDRDAL